MNLFTTLAYNNIINNNNNNNDSCNNNIVMLRMIRIQISFGFRISDGELASRLLSGGQLTTVRGLLASSPVAEDHLFWGLFELIRFHPNPDALLACLQLSPFSLVQCSPLSLGKACRGGRRNAHHHTRITALSRSSCVWSP